ncbi:hypothetical protein QG37_04728 [Candidozyma auris]|nr:hypothetical protein QG37_04728 [[Candida] auris]
MSLDSRDRFSSHVWKIHELIKSMERILGKTALRQRKCKAMPADGCKYVAAWSVQVLPQRSPSIFDTDMPRKNKLYP